MGNETMPTWEESKPLEIDRGRVPTWEESQPVGNPLYPYTRKNLRDLRASFTGEDPLAFIDDPRLKTDMTFLLSQSGDAESEKRKWALAAFFSQNRREDIQFCYSNLDSLIEAFNGGQKQSVDEAYADIGQILHGNRPKAGGFWESRGMGALVEGAGQVSKGTFNFFGMLAKIFVEGMVVQTKAELEARNPEAAKLIRDPEEAGALAENKVRGVYKEHYEPIRAWGAENMQLPDNWMTNSDGIADWCTNAALSIVNYIPQLAAQTGLTVATGGVTMLGTVYGINAYYEIKDDHPEMSETEAVIYGIGIGLINGGLEKITLGIIDGKVSKEVAKQGLKRGLLQAAKHFGWAAIKEGSEEGLEEIAENILDISMGLRGDTKDWKASDYWREIRRNVPEAVFLGAVTGAPLATDSYRTYRDVFERQEGLRSMVRDAIEKLSEKSDLTPEESSVLEKLKTLDDAADIRDVEAALRDLYARNFFERLKPKKGGLTAEEYAAAVKESQSGDGSDVDIVFRDDQGQESDLTDHERLVKEAEEALEHLHMRDNLPHNPKDTADMVSEFAKGVKGTKFVVFEGTEVLPEAVKADLRRRGYNDPRAFHYNGEVWLNASKVRPSEVFDTLTHEVVTHKGLRGLFGEERLNEILDSVYREHYQDEAFQQVAEAYKLGTRVEERAGDAGNGDASSRDASSRGTRNTRNTREERGGEDSRREAEGTDGVSEMQGAKDAGTDGVSEMQGAGEGDEYAEPSKVWYSVDDVVNQRIAAEEYLAHLAEAGRAKPSWWREFLQKIRMALGRLFGKPIAMTDKQIETLLARSARKMRRGMFGRRSDVETVAGDGDAGNGDASNGDAGSRGTRSTRGTREERGGEDSRREAEAGESDGEGESEGTDIQYSIVGEEGMENLSRESKEALKRLEYLKTAKEMLASGKDMKEIKLATGWELGKDGKWRTELPDLKVKSEIARILSSNQEAALKDVVDAPEIFAAYPEIADTPVKVATFRDESGKSLDSVAAAYDREEDCFYISPSYAVTKEGELTSVLIHELQHKIQKIEGFAPGGNPQQFQGKSEQLRAEVEEFRRKAEASEKYRRYEQLDREFSKFFATGTDAEIDAWNAEYGEEYDALHNDPEVQAINQEKSEIVKRYGNNPRVLEVLKDPGNEEAWKALALNDEFSQKDQYRRLAGEVESRNAQTRMDIPLEERLKTLLSETEDVAEDEKIYLEKGSAEARMSPLRPENAPNGAESKNVLRDSNVPHADGFMEWAGLQGRYLYADYEFLYARHWTKDGKSPYFNSQEEVRAAAELVLSKPEQVKDMAGGKNASFVGFDEETGAIYRIEIEKEVKAKCNHIRSVFEITPAQYRKIKLEPSRVLQPSQTDMLSSDQHARTISSFVRYNTPNPAEVKSGMGEKSLFLHEGDAGTEDAGSRGTRLRLKATPWQARGTRNTREGAADEDFRREAEGTAGADIRYMLAEYSEGQIRDIVAILKPYVGTFADRSKSDYAKYLSDQGVKLSSEEDALDFAFEAARQNNREARQRARKRRDDWIYENNPLWREVVDFCGTTEFKIRPSYRFAGEDFSGTWISADFVKYSEKRPQGKKESDASYRRYLERREKALKHADGMASDELAEAIGRKWDRDPLDVEQELIDYFRDLKKPDLYKSYTKWREESVLANKEERERAFDEWMRSEEARAEEQALEVLKRGEPITQEWIEENRKAYEALYRMVYGDAGTDGVSEMTENASSRGTRLRLKATPWQARGTRNTREERGGEDFRREAEGGEAEVSGEKKEKMRVPYPPSAKKLEELNALISMKNPGQTAELAEAYRKARIASWHEYLEKLRALRDKVMESKADALKLQREALDFAEKNLPAEVRGDFARGIVKLLEYDTRPSGKYPEGRRMTEFRNLIARMTRKAGEARKSVRLAEIKEMLDAAKVKRNYKGIPTSVLPSEQGRVDRIRQITEMNLAAVTNMIVNNNEQIELLEDDPEKAWIRERYLEDNALLELYGNLESKSADEVEAAAKELKKLIEGGKLEYREKLKERKAQLEEMQRRAVYDATFGKGSYKAKSDAKKHSGYWLKNETLGTLIRLVSGKSMQDFDGSVHGNLYRGVEDSTQKEQSGLRRMQQDLDDALGKLAGVTGKTPLGRMRKKGKFYRMASEVVEHSGVFKKEYSRMTKLNAVEEGRRGLEKSTIPVEDYEWQGKTYPGARSLLREIDNGGKASWHGRPLDDMAAAFLRQQLADYDTGLKNSYEIFHDEGDDADFNRILEEERASGRLMVIHPMTEEHSETVEVPLSQGQALQVLLTWEQEHYQANMKWNGWTEESIRQLKAFIKPEVLKMGYWMREYIARNKAALDAKVFERYGAHLPLNEKYFPGAFRGSRAKKVKVESELGHGSGNLSMNPSFLIARKFHLNPVDTDADAFSSFLGNQIEQEHFLAWSDVIRDLKGVYGSAAVQKSISDNFGQEVATNLVERISTLAAGGGKINEEYGTRRLGKFYRYWVPAKIALNPSSFLKQIAGSMAYMNRVPVKDFVKYMSTANFTNREYREFVKWAKDSEYMKNRMAGGLDKDLQYLLNYTRDSKAYSPFTDALMQAGTWQTRWADKWSALHGGYAAYKYALDQARKAGLTETEAIKAARRSWMRWTDETQQSGYFKDQNYFQANQGAWRYFTAFLSNPIQVMNLQLQTMNEIRYGADKKAAWKKLGRQVLVNHLVVPTLMQFVTDMLRHGFDIPEWWDEAEFGDYLLAWGLGSFEAAFLYGKLVQTLVQSTYRHWGNGIAAIPLLEDLEQDVRSTKRMITTDKELTEKDLMNGIKTAGDVGMLMGTADSRIGTVGGILSALGAQGKRILRWFEEDEKEKKK